MIFERAARGEIAQVGSEPGQHRHRTYGAPLPLEEQAALALSRPEQEVGVGVDRTQALTVAKVARGAMGRVELHEPGLGGPCLCGELRVERVHGFGVRQVAQQLARADAAQVAPGERRPGLARRPAPALARVADRAAVASREVGETALGEDQARVAGLHEARDQAQLIEPPQHGG